MEQAVKANGQDTNPWGPAPPSSDFRQVSGLMESDFEQVGPGQWAKKDKPKPVEFDPITRPEHYCKGAIEPWEFIEAQSLGFHEGSAVSYIARARHKGDEIGDLRKAINFLSRKVKLLEWKS